MKRHALLFLLLLIGVMVCGQRNRPGKPLVIKGCITNLPDRYLVLRFLDRYGLPATDTIQIDSAGVFQSKEIQIARPQQAQLTGASTDLRKIFIAPGYNLTITADGANQGSLMRTKRVTGKGAQSNRYHILIDSLAAARPSAGHWIDLNSRDLLTYIKQNSTFKDSVWKAVFSQPDSHDPSFKDLKEMVRLDNSFYPLYMLVAHVNWNNYDVERARSFVDNNFDRKRLADLYNDKYLISNDYRNWLVVGEWLDYLVNLDYKADSTLKLQSDYPFQKIVKTYKGKVRDFALFRLLSSGVSASSSFEEFSTFTSHFETFLAKVKNGKYQDALRSDFDRKKSALLTVQNGKAAPGFTLPDNFGSEQSLADFKDKVIYIDLWASWCGPCREETPNMKALFARYKDDDRIKIVSIAVHDKIENWKKALEQDKPGWIQLIDNAGQVSKAYFANNIPRFILIDKKGIIVDFDAPRPSSAKKLEALLDKEIAK